MYGAALNEGREMFTGDREFGEWLAHNQLGFADQSNERAAAMWASGNLSEYRETRQAHPRVRTVRGLHAKFKDNDKAPKPVLEPTEDDLKTIGKLQTLAERGSTEGERESAKAKLEAYSSAFGDQKEEVIERAAEAAEREREEAPNDTQVQQIRTALMRKGSDFLAEWLLKAMVKDHDLFKSVMVGLYK